MSTQSQTDELMVRSLRFNSSNGDNLIDVSAQFNHSDDWFPFNMDVLSPTTLQKAATAGNSISLNSGSYTNAQFYIASTNGNNVRTAFYANEQGGAIQVFDNNDLASLNLQPEGGALTVGGYFYPGIVDRVSYIPNGNYNLLVKDATTGEMKSIPSVWLKLGSVNWLIGGYPWEGGYYSMIGGMPGSWTTATESGVWGTHTSGGFGSGSVVLPAYSNYYSVQEYDHIIFCYGDFDNQIELPDPYANDGRELKFIVTTADLPSGNINYPGSGRFISFNGDYLPWSLYNRRGNYSWPLSIFPEGVLDYGDWGIPISATEQFSQTYGYYPPTSSLTIKSTYVPDRGQWYWLITDQSISS